MSIAGIILSGIYSDELDPITKKRTVASLPFGGRYRQIDFILSNMVNSDIVNVGIITKYNYSSLIDHLGSCQDWDLNRKLGGVKIIPPFASGDIGGYRGKIEELRAALPFLKELKSDYVVLADTDTLCNVALRPVIERHRASGRDLTIVASPVRADETDVSELVFDAEEGNPSGIYLNYSARNGQFSSDGLYVFGREYLIDRVEYFAARGYYHLERDLIQQGFNTGALSVGLDVFEGIVLKNRTIPAYLKNSLSLTDRKIREGLFRQDRPIYTAVRDEIPTYYGENSEVRDSTIADGCRIYGNIERSVIFRGVNVEKGAVVKNSVVMDSCVIRTGARVENAVLDKNVEICGGITVCGSPDAPAIIGKGMKVRE
ncbi:MAG: glucose-1-phosphate adenylyltransferase subunit GlgD [Clostridia bacterium]|nr:glucose-1-phosphate adenylyltransferase subunit GlgD [Clostridia bacterium]